MDDRDLPGLYYTLCRCANCYWFGKVYEDHGVSLNLRQKPCPNCKCEGHLNKVSK